MEAGFESPSRASARPASAGSGGHHSTSRRTLVLGVFLALLACTGDRQRRPTIDSGGPVAPTESAPRRPASQDPEALAERAVRALPPQTTLDRTAVTPHHVVLQGRTDSLDGVADVLSSLDRIPSLPEPRLHRIVRCGDGYEFALSLAASPLPPAAAAPAEEPERRPPPFARPAARRWLYRLLLPPFT